MVKQFYFKCDNGFIATVRHDYDGWEKDFMKVACENINKEPCPFGKLGYKCQIVLEIAKRRNRK